ncbi:MAG: hypothetical protein ABL908_16360, partial [Hyphomicrobium sp.]
MLVRRALAALALAGGWQLAATTAVPSLAIVTLAKADDDDGGGGGFGGGRGFRLKGIGIPGIGIGSISRMLIPRYAPGYRYRNRTQARAAATADAPRRGRGELIVAGLTADNIAALQQQGFAIAATRQSPTLGV